MDLVGDMLCRHLAEECGDAIESTQMRPLFRRRFARLPLVKHGLAWNADRLLNRFVDYPRWLRGQRCQHDIFHLVDHSYSQLLRGLPSNRTVVTCHDLDTFSCLLRPERESRPRWFRAMTMRILEGFQQAAHVIAVSAATRDELLKYGLIPAERISVVPNGVHQSCTPDPNPAADAEAARLLAGVSREDILLLNVGNTMPRKRLDLLLRVFAAVRLHIPQVRLVRAGGGFTAEQLRLAAELGVADALLVLPFLDRNALASVYRRAALLLHTADAEGFGLPVIEAQSCGTPVAASDIPVLREVGGTAVTYRPVADVDGWKDAVLALLEERITTPGAWELRRAEALCQSAQFSWAENARQTTRIYQNVLAAECA